MSRSRLIPLFIACAFLVGLFSPFRPTLSLNAQTDSRYFPETHHTVRGLFLKYWTEHGGLAQQGYPLTEEFVEPSLLQPGQSYTVQYFERAVFENHPENAGTPYAVLLSQLGKFQLDSRYPNNSQPAAAPQPAPGGVPAPPTALSGPPPATVAPYHSPTPYPTAVSSGTRCGATCNDGSHSNATGSGACSHHGGVAVWLYCSP